MYIKLSLDPWDNPRLFMLYDHFDILLDLDCKYFVDYIYIYVHQEYGVMFFFFSDALVFVIRVLIIS